jgi:hypothetical protein
MERYFIGITKHWLDVRRNSTIHAVYALDVTRPSEYNQLH